MTVVVTCGPACEPIDEVRRITNFSTGRLGAALAGHLTAAGHRVVCLIGRDAAHRGEIAAARTEMFSTAASLAEALESLAGREPVDAILHAAAVSDFTVARAERADGTPLVAAKIPSNLDEVRLILRPAPKILPRLRGWFPKAFIAGWKYELDGTREEAVARAAAQVRNCGTDLCVLNGRAYGPGFGLCDAAGLQETSDDHAALAAALLRRMDFPRPDRPTAGR